MIIAWLFYVENNRYPILVILLYKSTISVHRIRFYDPILFCWYPWWSYNCLFDSFR